MRGGRSEKATWSEIASIVVRLCCCRRLKRTRQRERWVVAFEKTRRKNEDFILMVGPYKISVGPWAEISKPKHTLGSSPRATSLFRDMGGFIDVTQIVIV
jgi:hypothetical protein